MRAYSTGARPMPTAPETRRRRSPRKDETGRTVNEHVARRIRLLRKVNGVTQTELGAVLGMTFQQMAKYERGIAKVAPDKLWKLGEYFGVEIGYFFEDLDQAALPYLDAHGRAPSAADSDGDRRLRQELARALQDVTNKGMMRRLLELIRVSAE